LLLDKEGAKLDNRLVKSSSVHRYNADHGLSKWGKRLWYSLNLLNNSFFPNLKSPKLQVKKFVPVLDDKAWQQVMPKSSPSRALSDLFWMQLPWEHIARQLGEIHVLDTGCGSGRYGLALQEYSGSRITSYAGLDENAHADWPEIMRDHSFMHLRAADSADFSAKIPDETNLFISQSAIEHFPEDLSYFRQIRDFISASTRPVMQIHLFPSAACLPLYRYHGVRQYTRRTVSTISSLFAHAKATLFELGGSNSNQLHWEFITRPVLLESGADRRNTETDVYKRELRRALNADNESNDRKPSFYALRIESGL
jgi:SAM-dependent methyltransferase